MTACGGPPVAAGACGEGGRSWQDELAALLRPGYVVLGIGNRDLGDDAAGPLVAEGLKAGGIAGSFDCGTAPENYLGKVARLAPRDVVIVDAADFGAEAGAVRLLTHESFPIQSAGTHAAGLAPLAEYLHAEGVEAVLVLAVQPAEVRYGAGVSAPVRQAVQAIVSSPVWR